MVGTNISLEFALEKEIVCHAENEDAPDKVHEIKEEEEEEEVGESVTGSKVPEIADWDEHTKRVNAETRDDEDDGENIEESIRKRTFVKFIVEKLATFEENVRRIMEKHDGQANAQEIVVVRESDKKERSAMMSNHDPKIAVTLLNREEHEVDRFGEVIRELKSIKTLQWKPEHMSVILREVKRGTERPIGGDDKVKLKRNHSNGSESKPKRLSHLTKQFMRR